MIRLVEELAEGGGAVLPGHIEIIDDAAKDDILFDATEDQSAGAEILLQEELI